MKIKIKWLYAKITRNEYKFCEFWVNVIADTFSNMLRYKVITIFMYEYLYYTGYDTYPNPYNISFFK